MHRDTHMHNDLQLNLRKLLMKELKTTTKMMMQIYTFSFFFF